MSGVSSRAAHTQGTCLPPVASRPHPRAAPPAWAGCRATTLPGWPVPRACWLPWLPAYRGAGGEAAGGLAGRVQLRRSRGAGVGRTEAALFRTAGCSPTTAPLPPGGRAFPGAEQPCPHLLPGFPEGGPQGPGAAKGSQSCPSSENPGLILPGEAHSIPSPSTTAPPKRAG